MLTQALKDLENYAPVFSDGLREDEDVVKVYTYSPFHDKVPEYVIHHGLEGGWAVCETEEHYQRFEQSSVGLRGCLPLITLTNVNIVVPQSDVKLCQNACMMQLVDNF